MLLLLFGSFFEEKNSCVFCFCLFFNSFYFCIAFMCLFHIQNQIPPTTAFQSNLLFPRDLQFSSELFSCACMKNSDKYRQVTWLNVQRG